MYQPGFSIGRDFQLVAPPIVDMTGGVADFYAEINMNDNAAGTEKIGLDIQNKVYAYNDIENDDYVLLSYKMTNTSGDTLEGITAGINSQWVFGYASGNHVRYDSAHKMMFAYSSTSPITSYMGVVLLSDEMAVGGAAK